MLKNNIIRKIMSSERNIFSALELRKFYVVDNFLDSVLKIMSVIHHFYSCFLKNSSNERIFEKSC